MQPFSIIGDNLDLALPAPSVYKPVKDARISVNWLDFRHDANCKQSEERR